MVSSRRHRGVILIGISLLAILAFVASDGPVRIAHVMARGAIQNFDLVSAQHWVERARRVSSRNPETELIAARIARRQGDLDEAADLLRQAEQWGADRRDVRLEELLALAQTGNLDPIESELATRLAEPGAPTDEISDAYANGLAVASRFEDAASLLAAWRDDYPDDPRPHYRLGRLHEHFERWEAAEAAHREALRINDDFHPARYRLGRVLTMQRRLDEAESEFRKSLEVSNPLAAKVELAASLRGLGRADEARDLLRDVLAHPRESIDASYRAFGENPGHFSAAAMLGDLESESGNPDEAMQWLQLALDDNPRDLTARYSMAMTLRQLGRNDEAEAEFERVRVARAALERINPLRDRVSTRPDDLEARLELGEILLEHESQKMGLFWIRSILGYAPNHAGAHQALARYYRQRQVDDPQYAALASQHERAANDAADSAPER